jgi:hypothetical protein
MWPCLADSTQPLRPNSIAADASRDVKPIALTWAPAEG